MKSMICISSLLAFYFASCTPISLPQLNVPTAPVTNGVTQNSAVNSVSSAKIPAKPKLEKLQNGHYRVLEDWSLNVSNRNFVVESGYTSNGITAPSYVKALLGDNINAPETWSAVFHDWCFTQEYLTRAQADDLFIQLMRDYRINAQKVSLMGTTVKGYSLYKGN